MNVRGNNFGFIRFIAALMVIAGHMAYITSTPVPLFLGQLIHALGVKTFFLIGGYLITKSWISDPHWARYIVKRAMRILPPLAAFVLFVTFIAGPILSTLPVKDYFANPSTWDYLKNIRLEVVYSLPGVFSDNPYPYTVNGSLWSLPIEACMYILVPVVLMSISFIKNKKVAQSIMLFIVLAGCGLSVAQILIFPKWRFVIYGTDIGQMIILMPYYLIGMAFTLPKIQQYLNLQLASASLLIFSCFNLSATKNEIGIMILYSYFIFSLALAPQPFFKKAFRKGEISYGLFLYGFFVQQAFMYCLGRKGITLSPSISFVICTLLTAFFAILSYRFVEKPSERLCKKLLSSSLLSPKIKK